MRAELAEHVALARTLGTQFHQVVVALAVGHQSRKLEQLGAPSQLRGVQAYGAYQHVDPLVLSEARAPFHVALEVEPAHLDGLQVHQDVGRLVARLIGLVGQVRDAPYSRHQQAPVLLHRVRAHQYLAHAQVLECGLVGVALLVERDGHLVDDALVLRLLDVAADGARLGALHVVFGQDAAHALHACFDLPLVVGGAVLPQEELQHVAWNRRVALHELYQVLAHNVSREHVVEFLV